jgi:Uma2 family endonuclease
MMILPNHLIRGLDAQVGIPAQRAELGWAGTMQVGVFMPNTRPVQPDFVFVLQARRNIVKSRGVMGVPDLIVEVLSPGNRQYDLEIKFFAYEKAGVPEYGILDWWKRELRVHRLQDGRYHEPAVYGVNDTLAFACLPTIKFRLGDVFAGAPQSDDDE